MSTGQLRNFGDSEELLRGERFANLLYEPVALAASGGAAPADEVPQRDDQLLDAPENAVAKRVCQPET